MRFYKKYWSSIRVFIKSYVYSFLLFYFAIDMWHLEKPSSQELEQYVGWLMPMIKKRINGKRKAGHYLIWCAYLLPDFHFLPQILGGLWENDYLCKRYY